MLRRASSTVVLLALTAAALANGELSNWDPVSAEIQAGVQELMGNRQKLLDEASRFAVGETDCRHPLQSGGGVDRLRRAASPAKPIAQGAHRQAARAVPRANEPAV